MKRLITALAISSFFNLNSVQADAPQFTLAVSESPSWSGTFLTAWDLGLIQGESGKLGPIEEKWNVDLVINKTDYMASMLLFIDGSVDAAGLTNIDSLPLSMSRKAVAILPTSTSVGADACIVGADIENLQALKTVSVKGLAGSVSEYIFDQGILSLGGNPSEFTFESLDPAKVGIELQNGQIQAGVTWNPFSVATLNAKPELKRLFDSSVVEGHVIHMIVASQASMAKPNADAFGYALCDTFFSICQLMLSEETQNEVLEVMSAHVGDLDLQQMQTLMSEMQFYATPSQAIQLFESQALADLMRKNVLPWSTSKGLLDRKNPPTISFGSGQDADLFFDTQYMEKVGHTFDTQNAETIAEK